MDRHLAPLWIPITAFVCAALIIFGISRVLLSFSREVTPFVALSIAIAILLVASYVASRVTGTEENG